MNSRHVETFDKFMKLSRDLPSDKGRTKKLRTSAKPYSRLLPKITLDRSRKLLMKLLAAKFPRGVGKT